MDEKERHEQIDPIILRLARFKGHQLAGKYGFARHDAEDIQQNLLLDYLQRSMAFDSHRCSHRSFARLVVNNRISSLLETQKAACRDHRVRQVSLDQSPDETSQVDRILSRTGNPCDRRSLESRLNLRLDIKRILSRLPTTLSQLCRLLVACDSHAEAAARAGISRATLYRRIKELQAVFIQGGMHGSLPRRPS
jgi:RNA polymerase sigma factor (sigma-70 family)